MKHIIPSSLPVQVIILAFFAVAMTVPSTTSHAQDDMMVNVREAFKIGSSKELIKCLGPTVEVKLDGARADYNRTQAEVVFRDFFKNCPPTNYEQSHQGSSPDGSKYAIDKYYCSGGSYVVWILMKETKGELYVSKVNILRE